ncbi:MAG: transcriptional regulator [Thermoplasmata archaeon]|nr:MAG: transcriptional regulator [Thermoplasmata archaeon]
MIEIKIGTLEERIIKILQSQYPITLEEISKKLGISKERTKTELLKLQNRGILVLEPLPDKTFVRLIRFDIRFVGKRKQYKFIKKKKGKIKKVDDEKSDNIMYA